MISMDRTVFTEGSDASSRMLEYGSLVKELHIIVFSRQSLGLKSGRIAENIWLYPTNSPNRFMYIFDAARIGRRLFFVSAEMEVAGEKMGVHENLADIVTAQDPFECGLAGWLIAAKLAVPLHLQIHTDFMSPLYRAESLLNKIRVLLARFLLRRPGVSVRAVSGRIKRSIAEKVSFPYGKFPRVIVLPIFIDIDIIRNAPILFDLHDKFPEWKRIILVVSRLEREKGVDAALQIFSSIPATNWSSVGLCVAGDGGEREHLGRLAEKLGIAERVAFLGHIPQSDLFSCYKTADLLLVASRYEGYGRQIMEAAASGCPVLSYDVGIAPEALTYWNGSVCPPGNMKCMKDTLRNWFTEEGLPEGLLIASRGAAAKMQSETKEEYLTKYQKMWEEAVRSE